MTKVLIVDEEPAIVRALKAALVARGYEVEGAASCRAALDKLSRGGVDIVLLDLGLPDDDGELVVRRVRQWSDVPIIVLTADGHEERKVVALDAGADDYVTKPFSTPELLARVRVALRHAQGRADRMQVDEAIHQVGPLRIDLAHHECTIRDDDVDLTPKEFGIVATLARWPGKVVTHRMLLHEVWGPEYTRETQYLRTYATSIRRKLAEHPDAPRLVSEPGVGYRLLEADDDDVDQAQAG